MDPSIYPTNNGLVTLPLAVDLPPITVGRYPVNHEVGRSPSIVGLGIIQSRLVGIPSTMRLVGHPPSLVWEPSTGGWYPANNGLVTTFHEWLVGIPSTMRLVGHPPSGCGSPSIIKRWITHSRWITRHHDNPVERSVSP
jgi:hypothetical protein